MESPETDMPSAGGLAARMAGIIRAPGAVFEALRDRAPDRRHWLVPPLLYIALTLVGTLLVVGRPGPAAQLRTLTEQEFLPQLEEYVRTGLITAEQSDWLHHFITPGTLPFILLQLAGTTITAAAALLLFALILRQIGRSALGRKLPFRKALEIVGLTFVVAMAERVVTTLLIVSTGSIFATPGPGIALIGASESTPFLLLSSINLFTLWEVGVASSGLARLCDRDFPKVLVLLLALWFLWTLLSVAPLLIGGT